MVFINKKIQILTYFCAFVYFCLIIFLCLYNFPHEINLPHRVLGIRADLIAHYFMFIPYPFIIGSLINYGFGRKKKRLVKYSYLVIFFTGIVFALLTELIQKYLTNYRTGDITDLIADVCGILTGIVLLGLMNNNIRKFLNKRMG